jgi:S-adenosyl-L-methionine hydrolase (adenosine-forming)
MASATGGNLLSPVLITPLSEFGTADYFVAGMKGAILSVDARIRLVDITHDIPPHDIHAAAFTITAVFRDFPPGTVHLAVVDPGVGSARRPIIVRACGHTFVAPDNGLLSWILLQGAYDIFEIDRGRFEGAGRSTTFHGRDLFAPAAARLTLGASPTEIGWPIESCVRMEGPAVERLDGGGWRGSVLHVDRFGNCVTSFTRDHLGSQSPPMELNGRTIATWKRYYQENPRSGEPFAIWGSAGYAEIAIDGGSAADRLAVRPGDVVFARIRNPAGG